MDALGDTVELVISIKVRLGEVVHAVSHDTDQGRDDVASNYKHD